MTATKALYMVAPTLFMLLVAIASRMIVEPLSASLPQGEAGIVLYQVAAAAPHVASTLAGIAILYGLEGSPHIRLAALGVTIAATASCFVLVLTGEVRMTTISPGPVTMSSSFHWGLVASIFTSMIGACFGIRVSIIGNHALRRRGPKRVGGRRALHGDARWMKLSQAGELFPAEGGIVLGERYRVDQDDTAALPFKADCPQSWGAGGASPLLCFDGSFGSTHGLVFAGSGGFKTTSVTVPTALKWGGGLVILDPSGEVASLVSHHRIKAKRDVFVLDPKTPETGFNVLDWIGRFGGTKEEDIAAVASWIMSEAGGVRGVRDDFFRASALQLLTALIADVCLSGWTPAQNQTLRQVRRNLSEPEPKLRERLQSIYDRSNSEFVRENVAAFVNMTPETFSGVYANAVKETHWLSYPNYAALVSGSSFKTDDISHGKADVIISIDLKALEGHSGLARVMIGTLLNAIYNRPVGQECRTLFLLDEVARLGYMRVLETARDVGRKYGITLVMIYQSLGQMRESFGGREAASKWFESASWISFAAINDYETADYISKRCGVTTVEAEQISRNSQARGASRTRSKQLAARSLIMSHEVMKMRADEQIIFVAGHPPLRCGRAIWFRRGDMRDCIAHDCEP